MLKVIKHEINKYVDHFWLLDQEKFIWKTIILLCFKHFYCASIISFSWWWVENLLPFLLSLIYLVFFFFFCFNGQDCPVYIQLNSWASNCQSFFYYLYSFILTFSITHWNIIRLCFYLLVFLFATASPNRRASCRHKRGWSSRPCPGFWDRKMKIIDLILTRLNTCYRIRVYCLVVSQNLVVVNGYLWRFWLL